MSLRLRCAWCGEALKDESEGEGESHGICEPCARRNGFLDAESLSHLTAEDITRLGLTFVGLPGTPKLRILRPAEGT